MYVRLPRLNVLCLHAPCGRDVDARDSFFQQVIAYKLRISQENRQPWIVLGDFNADLRRHSAAVLSSQTSSMQCNSLLQIVLQTGCVIRGLVRMGHVVVLIMFVFRNVFEAALRTASITFLSILPIILQLLLTSNFDGNNTPRLSLQIFVTGAGLQTRSQTHLLCVSFSTCALSASLIAKFHWVR